MQETVCQVSLRMMKLHRNSEIGACWGDRFADQRRFSRGSHNQIIGGIL